MNLENSLSIETPKLVHFGHLPIETNDSGNLLDGIVATRIENSNGIWRCTDRDDRMAHTHDIKTNRKRISYRKHIRNSEIENIEIFERERRTKIL